ncbi:hypothetical protein M527_07110 [Sphingobium indicum IP26]|nr:hypothetical protein M527_07110 [Sphingobium indicum IP26]
MNDFVGIRWSRDRLGLHVTFRLTWRLSIGIVRQPGRWAGSAYFWRRRIWLRPIDYALATDRRP